MDPIGIFEKWFDEECSRSAARIPSACCLSTIGTDGYPNARFVSFKGLSNGGLIITGPVDSRKGTEIRANHRVALTFWWPETERQVRIQGVASPLDEELADKLFSKRDRDSRLVSILSRQGQETEDPTELFRCFEEIRNRGEELSRPDHWGGFLVGPERIELMEFRPSRFHDRKLFERQADGWKMRVLQP